MSNLTINHQEECMQVQCHMSSWRQSKVGVVNIDAAKQMQQRKNTISDLSQSEWRYVLSPIATHKISSAALYMSTREKLGLRSTKLFMSMKKQKAAYKRLYPSRQRTSVIIKLMKAIEQFEKRIRLRALEPPTNLFQQIWSLEN